MQQDGTVHSGRKLPFDFRRLTDAEKQAIIDSARTAVRLRTAATAPVPAASAMMGSDVADPSRRTVPHQIVEDFFPIDQMPEYYPPVRTGAIKGDNNGRAWILPSTSSQSRHGELVYDIVDSLGEFQFRVQLPAGRMLAGFGKQNVVYLGTKTAAGWIIERTRLQK